VKSIGILGEMPKNSESLQNRNIYLPQFCPDFNRSGSQPFTDQPQPPDQVRSEAWLSMGKLVHLRAAGPSPGDRPC
jgi:hypothetical protein